MDIILRKWKIKDVGSLVKYANNINIAKNLTDSFPHPYKENDAILFINNCSHQNPSLVFAIDYKGSAIGSIGIFPQNDVHLKNAELGYWLGEPFWRKGIMSKAIREILHYAFNIFSINRIFARPFGTNIASQKLLEKSGFELEAILHNTIYKSGNYTDEFIYAIRKDKYETLSL